MAIRPNAAEIRRRMAAAGVPPLVVDAFLQNARRWDAGELGTIPGADLAPLGRLPRLEDLDEFDPAGEAAIAEVFELGPVVPHLHVDAGEVDFDLLDTGAAGECEQAQWLQCRNRARVDRDFHLAPVGQVDGTGAGIQIAG